MNLRTLKARHLKASNKNYWVKYGVHVQRMGNAYYVTTLYSSKGFRTIKEVKDYIRNGNYTISSAN